MKNSFKKKLGFLMSVVMVMGMMPIIALADTTNEVNGRVMVAPMTELTENAPVVSMREKGLRDVQEATFELVLENATWLEMFDSSAVMVEPSGTANVTKLSDERMLIQVQTDEENLEKISVELLTKVGVEGNAIVTIDSLDSVISDTTHTFATVIEQQISHIVNAVTNQEVWEEGYVSELKLGGNSLSSVSRATFELTLDNAFWLSGFNADAVETNGRVNVLVLSNQRAVIDIDNGDTPIGEITIKLLTRMGRVGSAEVSLDPLYSPLYGQTYKFANILSLDGNTTNEVNGRVTVPENTELTENAPVLSMREKSLRDTHYAVFQLDLNNATWLDEFDASAVTTNGTVKVTKLSDTSVIIEVSDESDYLEKISVELLTKVGSEGNVSVQINEDLSSVSSTEHIFARVEG